MEGGEVMCINFGFTFCFLIFTVGFELVHKEKLRKAAICKCPPTLAAGRPNRLTWPTPVSVKATTEGVALAPSALPMTWVTYTQKMFSLISALPGVEF